MPYRLGENSPPINTHSPPIGLSHLPITPTVLRPQPHLPIPPGSGPTLNGSPNHNNNNNNSDINSNNNTLLQPLSPLRIRVSSPTRLNSDLIHQSVHHQLSQNLINGMNGGGIIRIASSTGATTLHRPFSPSPKPKDTS